MKLSINIALKIRLLCRGFRDVAMAYDSRILRFKGMTTEKQREASRRYYQKNKEKINAKKKVYRHKHKEQHAEAVKRYRIKHKEQYYRYWRQYQQTVQRLNNLARSEVYKALKAGVLVKGKCVECGAIKVEAHHRDYSKPLNVIWMCKKHHTEEHY